jgi:type IV pilus assembly protein PilY1
MTPVVNDESNMQGANSGWASAQTYGGLGTWAPATPAADLLTAGADVQNFVSTPGCNFCQTKAVLYLGFGTPCGEAEPSWPSGGRPTISTCSGECNYVNPAAECTCSGTGTNWLPYVSNYLYTNYNTRSYFIGMGPHTTAMQRAAAEGQGKFFLATDTVSFHDNLFNVISDIIGIATSSATSTVNAVQVGVAGQEEIVPRFVASQTSAVWEGHLFKYYLFSEFSGDCSKAYVSGGAGETAQIPNALHPVCTAKCVCPGGSCTGRWLVDSDCDLITTDSTGFLFKATWNGTALVPVTNPRKPANAVWDMRNSLRNASWYNRKVYTAIDTNGDGVIDYRDGDGTSPPGMYLITAGSTAGNVDLSGGVSDAVADALAPYLGLAGSNRCALVSDFLANVGKVLPPGPPLRVCARVILNYMLGEDLANSLKLDPTDPNYLIGNRLFVLGDIFHSSPQDIGPPPGEDTCKYNNRRCVPTIFNSIPTQGLPDFQPLAIPTQVVNPSSGTMVSNSSNVDAYQAYYLNEAFGNKRPRAMVFGANDGQIHAVQTACYIGADTVGGTLVPGYWDGRGNAGCVAGSANNGDELWSFVAPDMLTKLANLLSDRHDLFVDNTPMVRDIYAPDPAATVTPIKRYDPTSTLTMDFKRIAIFGEREGGTHWHGLDVTNPAAPQYRWMFPQPNTADELNVGFSTGDWVPSAPPIVPIRLAAPTAVSGYPTYLDSSGTSRNFQEKWVVLLPGGYDPYGVAGKTAVYMLDAYTGQKIFQATNNGTVVQDFPFAALPAAVAWGTDVTNPTPTYNKGFFDTALVGDMGGQIWTVRFNDVGQGYPAGLVNNWFLGRVFRQVIADDVGAAAGEYRMQHRNPIFQMAAVGRTDTGYMRAYLGTGDRWNMAEPGLGFCSMYNPLACGKQNCVMTMATNSAMGSSPVSSGWSSFKGDLGASYTSSTTNTFTGGSAACAPVSTVLNDCLSCPGPAQAATALSPNEPQYACTNPAPSGNWSCSLVRVSDTSSAQRLEVTPSALSPDPNIDLGYYNRQFAVKVFDNGGTSRTFFTSASSASTYDTNALSEIGLTNLFNGTFPPTGTTSVTPKTDGNSAGFYFTYPALDERTATNAVLLQNCLVWFTMQPGMPCSSNADCANGTTCNLTTHECSQPTVCNASANQVAARTAYLYQINATDGSTSCSLISNNRIRTAAPTNSYLVPPPPPQPLISINSRGQVSFAIHTPAGGGGDPPAGAGSGPGNTPIGSFYYTLEMPRQLHQCRHPPVGTTPPVCF